MKKNDRFNIDRNLVAIFWVLALFFLIVSYAILLLNLAPEWNIGLLVLSTTSAIISGSLFITGAILKTKT